jgi:hypothetical protein
MNEGSFNGLFQSSVGGGTRMKNAPKASGSTTVTIIEGRMSSGGTACSFPLRERLPAA